ncbi:MAG: hypothetical protein K0Q59_2228 [Paenibacillus sp.]|nr:hypothetical protein [Paenibacillus sp.]
MSCIYIQSTAGISYAIADQSLYIAEGQLLKVEVLSLMLFRIYLNDEVCCIFERTELDFFLRHEMFRLVPSKDRGKQPRKPETSYLLSSR